MLVQDNNLKDSVGGGGGGGGAAAVGLPAAWR